MERTRLQLREGALFSYSQYTARTALCNKRLIIATSLRLRCRSWDVAKLADFVILDRDIMTVAERDILGTAVIATYIGGKPVYVRAALP